MKLKKSVYGKIFFGFITFSVANIIMILLWLFGKKDIEPRLNIGIFIGLVFGLVLDKTLNDVPYDEFDNDNIKFFILMIISIILVIIQGIFLR